MNLKKHFLEEDLKKAAKEYHCAMYCMDRVLIAMERGEYDEAQIFLSDITKSLNSLEVMKKKKETENSFKRLLAELHQKGVDIQVVRRGGSG